MIGFGPGSRNNKIGTIYQRVKGLLKSGALNEKEKPIWLDVWEAFPPAVQPSLERTVPNQEVKKIIYPEDVVRAKFNATFRRPLASIKNENPFKAIKSEVFVNEYIRKQRPNKSVDQVMTETLKALQLRDIHFDELKVSDLRIDDDEEKDISSLRKTSKGLRTLRQSKTGTKQVASADFTDLLDDLAPVEGFKVIKADTPQDTATYSVHIPNLNDGSEESVTHTPDEEFELHVDNKDMAKPIEAEARTVHSGKDMDSVIDDLLETPRDGKIRLDDFYGKAKVNLNFADKKKNINNLLGLKKDNEPSGLKADDELSGLKKDDEK